MYDLISFGFAEEAVKGIALWRKRVYVLVE
jgi:hypothetical protein